MSRTTPGRTTPGRTTPGRRVVVTGLGVINAAGLGLSSFWNTVRAGACCLSSITRFDATGFPVQVVGEVPGFEAHRYVPRRFVAKTDRFTHFALACVDEAIRDAKIDLDTEDRTRVGVWFGNNTGGWDLCEQGFEEYYVQGADVVNPWQATAWFLAAPQGFATIRYGIRGMSKSFSGDRASGSAAFYYGVRAIEWGRNDVVLAGGCEAPISSLSLLCFHSGGDLSEVPEPHEAYRPFDRSASGLVVGEGGVVLVLEDAAHAHERGVQAYLEVLGGAHGTALHGDHSGYSTVLTRALRDAGCTPDDVDLVLCEGVASKEGDQFELDALASVFGRSQNLPIAVPKSMFGHLYGASFGTDVACGALAVRDGLVPPTPGFEEGSPPQGLQLQSSVRPQVVNRFMVISHSRYGSCVAMVFGRPEPHPKN